MRQILCVCMLVVMAAFGLGCNEALISPNEHLIEGFWVGTSWMTHPGQADEPITDSLEVHFTFEKEGTFIYGERPRDPIMPPVAIYQGEYTLKSDSIILTVSYSHPDYSPLHLEGTFELTFSNDSARFYQVVGDEWPNIYELKLIPGFFQSPPNPLLGQWQGISRVTYPGPADEPISDSLEIIITFDEEAAFSYHWVGDEISFPVVYDGDYSLKNDTVILENTANPPYRTPLYLLGPFEISASGDSLRLYQHPPHIWPDIYDLRLVRRDSLP